MGAKKLQTLIKAPGDVAVARVECGILQSTSVAVSNYLKEAALRNRSPCGDGVGGGGSIEGGHKEFGGGVADHPAADPRDNTQQLRSPPPRSSARHLPRSTRRRKNLPITPPSVLLAFSFFSPCDLLLSRVPCCYRFCLALAGLLPEWNKGAHVTAYVDFAGDPFAARPWASFSTALEPPSLGAIRGRLESELEALVDQGVRRGSIGCRDVFDALNKWHGLHTALKRIIGPNLLSKRDETASVAALWSKAMFTFSSRIGSEEINANLATEEKAISAGGTRKYSMGEVAHMRETAVSIKLAKEVIKMHQEWRREAVRDLNRKGGFSRSLANSSTDWPSLLLDILSSAAEIDFFQVKRR